jgi:hypothetical protein
MVPVDTCMTTVHYGQLEKPAAGWPPLSQPEARALTQEIADTVALAWDKVVQAYQRRVWEPLGYGSWDCYCRTELGATRLRLPLEDREQAVRSLRTAGLSTRAIASATGQSRSTVHRGLAAVPSGTPESAHQQQAPSVTGLDGKSYAGSRAPVSDSDDPIDTEIVDDQAPQPVGPPPPGASSTAKRRSLTEAAKDAGWEIRRAAERIARIVGDDRLPTNKQQVSAALGNHLHFVAETVTAALGQLSDHMPISPAEEVQS